MTRSRIIYRLIFLFVVFALMITVPFTLTMISQVKRIVTDAPALKAAQDAGQGMAFGELSSRLLDHAVPYIFYILVMAIMLAIFFSRKLMASLNELHRGSVAIRNGDYGITLRAYAEDELAEVIRSFNDMTSSIRLTTSELRKKDMYVNAMLDPLWVVDDMNRLVDVNPAFVGLFGYQRDEILGFAIDLFITENPGAPKRDDYEVMRHNGASTIYEADITTRHGTRMPALISESPILSDGAIIGKIGILRDFREQRELREEIQRSRDYVETVINSIEDQLMVIDRDYRIVSANHIALESFGEKIIGEPCHAVAHDSPEPCWAEGRECPVRTVFGSGTASRVTHRHVNPDGQARYHEIVASPIKDLSGNVVQVIELIRDVSDRIRHEEDLFLKNRELVALNSIAGILSRSLRPDEIFASVLDKMIELMKMGGGGIFFIDEQNKDMLCQYHRGISDEYVTQIGRIQLGQDIPGQVAMTGQIITTADISTDPRVESSMMKNSGIKGYCCVPIRGKERIIGVYCLFSFKSRDFTPEEENILVSIGEMTGIALENIRLYEKMKDLYNAQKQRRDAEQDQLLSLTAGLGSEGDLRHAMGSVLEILKNIFHADYAWLLVRDSGGVLVLKASSSDKEPEDSVIFQCGARSIEDHSLEIRGPVVVSDIPKDTRFYIPAEISGPLYKTAVSVPMCIGEKAIGVFSLYYLNSRKFDDEELHFLKIIANMLSVSLERYNYYTESVAEKGLSAAVLQGVRDCIVTVDTGGKIISANRSFERLSGIRPDGERGLHLCDAVALQNGNRGLGEALKECLDAALSGNTAARESVMVTADNRRILMKIDSAPILDPKGKITGAVNVLRDISREKEIDTMKTEIIRSVSHEFRTPLSAIVGMTEMILDGDIDAKKEREYLQTVFNEGVRLSNMVSDLLSIAKIEGGMEKITVSEVEMKSFFDDLMASVAASLEKKGAVVSCDTGGIKSVMADGPKLKQVLLNILDNSLTFSDRGCHIAINVKKGDNTITITVRDDGWGIPEEDLPHLKERFFRGRHGARIKGTGLGLFICSEILRMHGGSMKIESIAGAGTEVSVNLPITGPK
ncbi:MAG: PAS domain S-box protein [Nitrospirae bacterium]|nr:PAS domain S-box protein [Nitrospirota bacterium]